MKLTLTQQQAVEYNQGPLLIIAGAGTGKTTVLVEKIHYLVKNNLAKPDQIVALTFTEKAASEMEERVDQILPYGYTQTRIGTFHSFCDSILRENAHHTGLSPSYTLHTQAQSIMYLKKHFFEFSFSYFRPLGNPYKFIEALIKHFSRLKDENISPEEYASFVGRFHTSSNEEPQEKEKLDELARAYRLFQKLKEKESIFDFGDLIFYTILLFKKRKNILSEYQKQFVHILVDEFQDTNLAQYELIKLLAPENQNPHLTVVGDDSQSIYKFRGAAISNILQFMDYYKNAHRIVLNENFRSYQTILDSSYELIRHNNPDTLEARLGISKNLISMKGKGRKDDVQFHCSEGIARETDYAAREIISLTQKGYAFSDIALLVRANNHVDAFVNTFHAYGIPYQFLGRDLLLKQPEVKELIAYLQFLTNIEDNAALYRVLSMRIFDFDSEDLARLMAFVKKTSLCLYDAIKAYLTLRLASDVSEELHVRYAPFLPYLPALTKDSQTKLEKFFSMIKSHLARLKKDMAVQIVYSFLDESGLLRILSSYKSEREERQALNISQFFTLLQSLPSKGIDGKVNETIEYLQMSMEYGESSTSESIDKSSLNAVNITTVHSSKGLEFPVVFLVNLSAERFPTRKRQDGISLHEALIKELLPTGDYHLQEERRLFYVGLTRAQKKVYLSSSLFYGEGRRKRSVSPFVIETIGSKRFEQLLSAKDVQPQQMTIFDFPKPIVQDQKRTEDKKDTALTLSFSQIETYAICPLRYKYQYVVKIPTLPNSAASFGETIHKALFHFYRGVKKGEKPDLEKLLSLYESSWIPIGYTSSRFEAQMKQEGKLMLTRFFHTYYVPDTHVKELEQLFKLRLSNNLSIVGKIDRVDVKHDGEIEIIDYKTGKKPDDRQLQKSLQLSIYALAAIHQGASPEKVRLTFYFLQHEEGAVSFKKTKVELDEVKEKLHAVRKAIVSSEFLAKVGPWCQSCPFKINCEAWQ